MKKAFVVLTFLLFLMLVTPAYAAPRDSELSGEIFQPQAYTYLVDGVVRLNYLGNGNFSLYGETRANQSVSEIKVEITLQRWNGLIWVDLVSYDNEESYSKRVTVSKVVTVPAGHYYRLAGRHTVRHNAVTEIATNYTSSFYLMD